jgi:hypothetical protein
MTSTTPAKPAEQRRGTDPAAWDRAEKKWTRKIRQLIAAEGNRRYGFYGWAFAFLYHCEGDNGSYTDHPYPDDGVGTRAPRDFPGQLRALLDAYCADTACIVEWKEVHIVYYRASPDGLNWTGEAVRLFNPDPDRPS